MKVSVLFLLLSGVLVLSCKKQEDTQSPRPRLLAPGEFTQYSLPATLTIQGEVSDETEISSIELRITDPNGLVVAQTSIEPQSNPITFSRSFSFNDPLLPGGDYLIRLKASDGKNNASAFRTIRMFPVPLAVESIFIAVKEGSNSRLSHLDGTTIQPDWLSTLDVRRMYISPREDLILLRSADFSLEGIESSGSFQRFLINTIPVTAARFDRLKIRFFIAKNSSSIDVYSRNGVYQESYSTGLPGTLTDRFEGTDHYWVVRQLANPDDQQIDIVSKSGNVFTGTFGAGMRIVHLKESSHGTILLFGQNGSDFQVKEYAFVSGSLSTLQTHPSTSIREIVEGDNDIFFLGGTNGLFAYQGGTNSWIQINGTDTRSLDWDPVSESIYQANGNQLIRLAFPSGNVLETWTAADSIRQVRILLNR